MENKDIQIFVGILDDGTIHCQIVDRKGKEILFEKTATCSNPSTALDALYNVVPNPEEFKSLYNKDQQPIVGIRDGVKMIKGHTTMLNCKKLVDTHGGTVMTCFESFFKDVGMELLHAN